MILIATPCLEWGNEKDAATIIRLRVCALSMRVDGLRPDVMNARKFARMFPCMFTYKRVDECTHVRALARAPSLNNFMRAFHSNSDRSSV